METLQTLVERYRPTVGHLMPWELAERRQKEPGLLIIDVREPAEFARYHIEGTLNVPRGILELACDYGYADTVPALVNSRDKPVIVICGSGYRSVLAAHIMTLLGYREPISVHTGIKGWNEADLPLVDADGNPIDGDEVERIMNTPIRPDQQKPGT